MTFRTTVVTPRFARSMEYASIDVYALTVMVGNQVGQFFKAASDPIGSTTVTLTDIVDGSSLQIESQDGTQTFHNSVVSGTSKAVTLSVYAAGSPYNSLRIKIRKGTASPFYIPWETVLTAVVGSQSIYVTQVSDE